MLSDHLHAAITALTAYPVPQDSAIVIDITLQQLYLIQNQHIKQQYPISSSRYGIGNRQDSYQTPLGIHKIAAKIGEACQPSEILRGRVATGIIYQPDMPHIDPGTGEPIDYITSRILWLAGLQPGINQGGQVDSQQRYIYIHGTAAEQDIGQPASIGCIRMRNADIIQLFDQIETDLGVNIIQSAN